MEAGFEEAISFAEFRASFNGEEILVQDASGAEVRRIEGSAVKRF